MNIAKDEYQKLLRDKASLQATVQELQRQVPATPETIKSEVETYYSNVNAAVLEWMKANPPAQFARQQLEKQGIALVAQLIGFTNHWGKWEVDHCNGRISPASEAIKDIVKVVVDEQLKQVQAEVAPILEEMKRAAKKDFEDRVRNALRQTIYEESQKAAQRLAQELSQELNAEAGALFTFKKGGTNVSS